MIVLRILCTFANSKYFNMDKQRIKRVFYSWVVKNGISNKSKYLYGQYLEYPKKRFGYTFTFDDIEKFWNIGDIFYAISVCDIILEKIESGIKEQRNDDLSDAQSAFRKLRVFLLSNSSSLHYNDSEINELADELDEIRDTISRMKKSRDNFPKLDGNDSLLAHLGIKGFIKLVVESSFFFSPDIAKDRNSVLVNDINQNNPLPCRKSEDQTLHNIIGRNTSYKDSSFECNIKIDSDNNAQVRSVIKNYIGYTVSEGRKSLFKNYIISHIWGRAYDPRYFTSMWNIALIPAWANSLMDKENPERGTFESKIQSTFKAICQHLYDRKCYDGLDFSNYDSISKKIETSEDVLSDTYLIKVIQNKTNKQKVASILSKPIHIL